jgi:hypothetical protein
MLYEYAGHIPDPPPTLHYLDHHFTVPEGVTRLSVKLSFVKTVDAFQLYVSLHDPAGHFRGHVQCPGPGGPRTQTLWIAVDGASPGSLAGPIPPGVWRAQIDLDRHKQGGDYRLAVEADHTPAAPLPVGTYPPVPVVNPAGGWYRGELHAHSEESDGRHPVATVVDAAVAEGLDFLALTDHFTVSQWQKLAQHLDKPIALLRACEITSHHGHANLQGIRQWTDVYVDRPDWSMNDAARAVHAQGGLFCVNHPFSGDMAWRDFAFDWSLADLIEIHHQHERSNNDAMVGLWDRLLAQGYRIVGVGGTDAHNPLSDFERFGQLVTWVDAPELSEPGIIAGLRRGRVYASRGPELRFRAHDAAGHEALMWEMLPGGGGELTLEVAVREIVDAPLRAFIIKNGLIFAHTPVPSGDGWRRLHFTDQPQGSACYRLELHRDYGPAGPPDQPEIYPRHFASMRALSNPIWVGAMPPLR